MDEKKKVLFSFVGNRDPYSKPDCASAYKKSEETEGKFKRFLQRIGFLKKVEVQDTLSLLDSDSEGSILTACRWLKPDIVYLFPSSKEKAAQTNRPENHTEDRANEVQKILTSEFGVKECIVMPLMTDDATDATKLYICLRNNMRKIFKDLVKNYPDHELIFILTSGTQQMNETARVFLPSLPYEFNYYRCIAPQYAQGQDRVKPDSLKLADETILLRTIEANVEGCYFHSLIENFERLNQVSIIKPRQGRALTMKEIFSAYAQMNVMQYEEAYLSLAGTARFLTKHKEQMLESDPALPIEKICGILDEQVEFLKKLKDKVHNQDESEDENNLIDLCYNMERSYSHGNYADVLARFWRLREGMMNYRMLILQHLDRRNLNRKFQNPDDEKARKRNYDRLENAIDEFKNKIDWDNGWVRNDLGAMVSLLTRFFQDGPLDYFEKRYRNDLEYLRIVRNRTFIAHGMLPVSKEDADKCISLKDEIIKLIPGGEQVYASYPFKPEDMLEILNLLKYI